MTIATCGHALRDDEGKDKDGFGTMIAVADYDGPDHVVCYPVVCDKCLSWYKRKKIILTGAQVDKWLKSTPNYETL